jgi:serine/threonine-protein kinase PknK
MRRFGRRDGAVANPSPEVLSQRLDALAGVDLQLPNYHEFSVLARGGSSVVFLARERRIDRPVAIKVLPPEKELHAVKQFEREKEIAVSLGRHPYIVQVFDAGAASDGSPFLVMEYFERGSLADRIRAEGPLSVEETVGIIEKIGSALQAAHDAGILHRDVKPSNILFSEYGPSLSDFGISRSMSRGEWTQSLAHFTPWHSAPEILEGDNPSIASDVYSLASTMFTALEGRPPFVVTGDDRSLAYQLRVLRDPLPTLLRRDLPAGLHDVLVKAMAKLPADRFDSVASFLVALRGITAVPAPVQPSNISAANTGSPSFNASSVGPATVTPSSVAGGSESASDGPEFAAGALPDEEYSATFGRAAAPPVAAPVTADLLADAPGTVVSSNPSFPTEVEDDAMFRPPSNPIPSATGVDQRDEASAAVSTSSATSRVPEATAFATPGSEPRAGASDPACRSVNSTVGSGEEVGPAASVSGAVRTALPMERRSPSEEEATVLGQRRVVAPTPPTPKKRQLPLAWIALIVTALIGGLTIAFYPGKKSSKPIAVVPTIPGTTVAGAAGGGTTVVGGNKPSVDPLPRVSASSPQQVTVTEKLEESGEFSLAEIRWTDGTPPLVAAYVAASKQGGVPTAAQIDDAASKRAVIVGIDPKAAYCFWVVAFDTSVRPIVQYRSEQQCVRGGVPYNFEQQAP